MMDSARHVDEGTLRARLRGDGGASIIIALVFFLVCAVIASVVISAASVNSTQRDSSYLADEQAYLTLSSAAKASKGVFSTDAELARMTVTVNGSTATVNPSTQTGTIAAWVATSAKTLCGGGTPQTLTTTISGIAPSSASQPMSTVNVKYTMDADHKGVYDITSVVSFDSSVGYGYSLKTTIPSSTATSGSSTIVSWNGTVAYDASGYLAASSSMWSTISGSYAGQALVTQTHALQTLFFQTYASAPLTAAEQALNSGYASGDAWKPLLDANGKVFLAACDSTSTVGAARNASLIYYGGHYYKIVTSWGRGTTAYISDQGTLDLNRVILGLSIDSFGNKCVVVSL